MTEQEFKALFTVVAYLWRDEQKNFEECKINDDKAPDDHIFRHLETLDAYLARELTDNVPSGQTSDVSPFI